MNRQKRTKGKILSRLARALRSWRWRAVFAAGLVGITALPLALIADQVKVEAEPCPCTAFTNPTSQNDFSDGAALELGFKFRPNIDGYITGVRFYKQGAMSGTHTGRLWTEGGSEMAMATFTETPSGWQEVTFSSPQAVTANTTYVASVTMNDGRYIATTNYFTTNITNGPLTVPSSASSGGNGVFSTTAGTFPTNGANTTNYWVDVSFIGNQGSSPPVVNGVTPTDGSTNVNLGETVSATFDDAMDPGSFTSSTFEVRDSDDNSVAGTYSYSASSKTASFVATDGLALGKTYTATLRGGSGTTVTNLEGIALAADYTWSFTASTTNACPCTLKDRVAPQGSSSFDDSDSLELGIKVKPTTNGYITALRFYKPIISTETTHTMKVWNSTGTQLAAATTSNETDYGWQEVKLSTPLQVSQGQLYVVSYGTTTATYQASFGGVNSNLGNGYLIAYADNSAENAATGSGNRNGVFSGTAGNYPASGSTNGAYYWVDAVFSTAPTPEYPFAVTVTQPEANDFGIMNNHVVTAAFNRVPDASTITASSFRLFDSNNVQVSGSAAYDAARGLATFTPSSPLTGGERYTAKLASSVADQGGIALGSEYSWSFTAGTSVAANPNQGPGGPVLVITATDNKYSPYYAEILRTEGLNYFDVKDMSTVDSAVLANYSVVVLAEMVLSQSQADMFGTWVSTGGNLVAMRPDSKLASLLGLTPAGSTRTNQYLLIDTATTPGNGLVGETIQWKGTADNYTLNGATSIATFYSDASTSTANPAVTSRAVGNNGGTAVAFAYDLAKSVIAQHQGNQAWAGQNRDGLGPIRTNDLFFGAMTGDVRPDWVEAAKFHIPQADEQQRLLANLIIEAARDLRPLPRFWYLPGDYKAAMVVAGDDHGLGNNTGSEMVLGKWLNESSTDCSLLDWECVRASHYVYTSSALTDARALQFHNLGYEIGDHVSTTCNNWVSFAALSAEYTADLDAWRAKYSSLPNQRTHRYHCYVWSDWDSQSRVEIANGMRYDLNYVALPSTWVGSKAPLMTGSGMNMRFTDADGDMMDIRQGVTNFDDTVSTTTNIDALLDNTLDSSGYYGVFGTHYDMTNTYHDTVYAAARAKNVPMISSEQALTWFDGRDSSSFGNFTGSAGRFGFTVTAAVGTTNMKAMLPILDAAGQLATLARDGTEISYDTRTIKGVQYAVFEAQPGAYTATYTDYDPNANTGGNNGSATGSTSSNSSTAKKKVALENSPTPETAPQPENTAESNQINPAPQNEKEFITPADGSKESGSWIWWILGGFGLSGVLWWVVFTLRRRSRPPVSF